MPDLEELKIIEAQPPYPQCEGDGEHDGRAAFFGVQGPFDLKPQWFCLDCLRAYLDGLSDQP